MIMALLSLLCGTILDCRVEKHDLKNNEVTIYTPSF